MSNLDAYKNLHNVLSKFAHSNSFLKNSFGKLEFFQGYNERFWWWGDVTGDKNMYL